MLATILLIGCSSGSKSTPEKEEPTTYTVSGKVTHEDRGVEGIRIYFYRENETTDYTDTDSEGNWEKTNLSGIVNIVPDFNDAEVEGYIFNPPNYEVSSAKDKVNFIITVDNYLPEIDIRETRSELTVNLTGSITDNDGTINSVTIDWGDENSTMVEGDYENIDETHTYAETGQYEVVITAVDDKEGSISETLTINVLENDQVIQFEDANFEEVIRFQISKPSGIIYQSDVIDITRLEIRDVEMSSIDGIQYIINLEEFALWDSKYLEDISPLSELTNLDDLAIIGSNVSDISTLSNMNNLRDINIERSLITDVSPVSGLTNITSLSFEENQISDITPLSNLTNLKFLDLSMNEIVDISILDNLTMLTELRLHKNQINDISPLSGLIDLGRLNLSINHISDLSALSNLTNLYRLDLMRNDIGSISPLADLSNLKYLDISIQDGGSRISDLSPLTNKTNLRKLELGSIATNDLSPLSGLTNLTLLEIGGEQISDISPLYNLVNLEELSISSTQISDISIISNLSNLRELYIAKSQIVNIQPLSGLENLRYLNIRDNNVVDLSPLTGCPKLNELYAKENQIIDISPLIELRESQTTFLLEIIDLRYNYLNTSLDSKDIQDIEKLINYNCIVEYIPQNEPPTTYTLTVNASECGSVEISPDKELYYEGDIVTITAVPDTNCDFAYWEGSGFDGDRSEEINLTIESDITLNAIFGQIEETTEEFNNNEYNWPESNNETYTLEFTDSNKYSITVKNENYLVWAYNNRIIKQNFEAGVDFEYVSSDTTLAGFCFNYSSSKSDYYIIRISNTGSYIIESFQNNNWTTIVDWTSVEVNQGVNHISVEKNGTNYSFSLNGEALNSVDVEDNYPTLALLASSGSTPPSTVLFDNFTATWITIPDTTTQNINASYGEENVFYTEIY